MFGKNALYIKKTINNKKYIGKALTYTTGCHIILNYIKRTINKDDEEKSRRNPNKSESATVEGRWEGCVEEHLGVSDRNAKSRLRRFRTVITDRYRFHGSVPKRRLN
jgi:hypothetical protein